MDKPHKPMVLAAMVAKSSTYLVVGVSGSSFSGQKPKYPSLSSLPPLAYYYLPYTFIDSEFAANFLRAAKKTNSRMKRTSFDGSVVEVLMDDLTRFIEYLHAGLS